MKELGVITALCAVALAAAIVFLGGCPEFEESSELTEPAKVLQLCYSPGSHGTGVGLTTGGDIAVVPVTVEPSWAVVFECQHGRFVIEDVGRDSRAHRLWGRLKEGQSVSVRYREVYSVSKGVKTFSKYRFVDAQ